MSTNLPSTLGEVEFIRDLPLYHTEKPYYIAGPLDKEHEPQRTNAIFETRTVKFLDLRGNENLFQLEKDGFAFVDKVPEVCGSSTITMDNIEQYAQSTANLMKRIFGSDHCWTYAYKFRSSADFERPAGVPTGDTFLPDEPAVKAHIDQTLDGGFRRIRRHLTLQEQAKHLDRGSKEWRFLIINTWRPLNRPVSNYPLAVCHPRTVTVASDGIATDRVSPDFQGENYYLKFRSGYEWYWLSNQRTDELLLFSSFDSAQDTNAVSFVPHCSFKVQGVPNDAPPRESIETRTIVAIEI